MGISLRVWLIGCLVATALYEFGPPAVSDSLSLLLPLAASFAGLARARTLPRGSRSAWLLISIGGLLAIVGNVIRVWEEEQAGELYVIPSWGDPFVVATYLLLFAAMARLIRRRSFLGEGIHALDALVVAVGIGAISYWEFVGPYLSDESVPVDERLFNGGYWLLSLGILAGAARLAVGRGQRPRAYYFLLGGMIAFGINDMLVIAFTAGEIAYPVHDATLPLIFVLLAAAAIDTSAHEITDRPIADEARFSVPLVGTLALTLFLAPLIAALQLAAGEAVSWPLVVGLPVVTACLALSRVVSLLRSERARDQRFAALRLVERGVLEAERPGEMVKIAACGVFSLLPELAEARVSYIDLGADEPVVEFSIGRGADAVVDGTVRSARGLRNESESVSWYDALPMDMAEPESTEVLVYHAPVVNDGAVEGSLSVTCSAALRRGDLDGVDHLATELAAALKLRRLMDELFRERAERRFKTLVENSSDIVMVLDERDRITFISPAVQTVLGRREDELMDRDIRVLGEGDDARTVDRFIHATRAGTSKKPIEIQTRRADGALRWFELLGRDHTDNAEIDGVVVTARDITDRKAADDRLGRSEARFRSLVQHSSDVIAVIDGSGFFAYVTPSVTSVLGYRPDSMVGTTVFDLVAPGHRDRVEERLALISDPFTRIDLELDVKAASGRYHTLVVTLTDLRDEPAVDGIVLNARDITQHRSLQKDLEQQSVTDRLTGLPNRAGFIGTLQAVLDDPNAPSPTVLLLDLDDFKTLNDTLGHSFGDDILNAVADRMRTSLRLSDHAARLGGDEFAVLLRDAYTQTDVQQATDRLLEDLRAPLVMRGKDIDLSASVGVAMAGSTDSAEDLIRNADAAMYRAKDAGKNRSEMFEEQIHAEMLERLELKNDLRRGLSNDELVLHYQPIVNLGSDRITGAEALVRWAHPRRGVLAPGAFIAMAEESGLINRIGAWVFEKACLQVMEWNERREPGEQLTMSINLSARQLETDETVDELLAIADRIAVPREMIILELTESVLIEDLADKARLSRLQSEGFRLAVDDFGTGYSGLAYLQNLPFDIIKVDRAFVTGVDTNVNRATFLESILELAKGVGAKTIGEGIEGAGELDLLRKLGFDFGQGYYFSRPVPHGTFATMIGLELTA